MAGGGVGEAMLIGAAVGAGTGAIGSAVQDKDPLEGALLGAAMGAAGGGIGSWAGGATAGLEGAAATSVPGAATSVAPAASTSSLVSGTAPIGSVGGATVGSGAVTGATGATAPGATSSLISGSAPFGSVGGATVGAGAPAAPGVGTGMFPALSTAQAYGAGIGGALGGGISSLTPGQQMAQEPEPYSGPLSQFKYSPNTFRPSVAPGYADGGITDLDVGRRQAYMRNAVEPVAMMASGGISHLGSYSDGGRMLKGPGDGMSDDIPGVIAGKQPARLADGEFVVPADVVSHLGNGSTDAGAKQLYAMMDRVRKARTGTKKQGKQINPEKHIPGMAEGGIAHFAFGGLLGLPKTLVIQNGQIGTMDDSGYFVPQNGEASGPGIGATGVSSKFKPTGFDSNYYNRFNPEFYLAQNPDVAQSIFANDPLQHYIQYGQQEGRLPFENAQASYKYSPEGNVIRSPQQQYTEYTMSNRPSSSEPQFYGNIYKVPDYGQYARPGYEMNANLGAWSNEYGAGGGGAAAQQMADIQAIAQQTSQAAQSAKAAQESPREAPKEEKKRRGGIASLV